MARVLVHTRKRRSFIRTTVEINGELDLPEGLRGNRSGTPIIRRVKFTPDSELYYAEVWVEPEPRKPVSVRTI